jgi:phospholipid/cholesterol/gamma-HCH transport system ATP-binding protein
MIRLENIHRRFGPKAVLRGVDLEVERGESRVVIGRSGEGKSVLLRHICGLIWPDRGRVFVEGRELRRGDTEAISFMREKVNMLFQSAALFDSLDVRGNVGFSLDERGALAREEIDARVAECLALVNLPGREALMPSELSGGMRKRVGLARALITRPDIMLYDEPTTGLDPITADMINDLIVEMKGRLGVTSLVVTHDMASAYKVADRISMLADGAIILTGTPEEIRNSDDPRVRQFIEGRAEGPLTEAAVAG